MTYFKKAFGVLFISFIMSMDLAAQSKTEMKVAAAVQEFTKLMINPDRARMESLVSEDLSYGHSGGKVENRTDFINAFVNGSSDFVTIDITDQSITVHGKTAIVRHTLAAATNDNNKPATVKLKIMTVWCKEGGKWKLLARQAVKA